MLKELAKEQQVTFVNFIVFYFSCCKFNFK